mmetsp:Transcript_81694/g.212449  ORF Transcript_81694/g.212449 Transcript_81694/m.212449 type:complete len:476 (+) Transcript_81694:93-1520(+)
MVALGMARGYSEVREIGRGSFGTASLARDRQGRVWAMKTVDVSRADDSQTQEAQHEAVLLASLKHPYIVRFHDSFIDEGSLVIVMDFAEGGDLHDRISAQRSIGTPFREQQVLRWVTQVALGLKYLHGRLILHRDIKSQNILLNAKGDACIADFGIARVLSKSCGELIEAAPLGSPGYLSPEIYNETLYSFSSDVWALGCIFFELANLRMPFEARSLPALALKVTQGPAPALPQVYKEDLRQLGADMLSYNRESRPSAEDIVQRPVVRSEMSRMLQDSQERSSISNVAECQEPTEDERQGSQKQGPFVSSKDLRLTPEHGVARPWVQILSDPEGKAFARPARQESRASSEAPAMRRALRPSLSVLQPPDRRREPPAGRSSPSQTLLRSGSATLLTSNSATLLHSPSAGGACARGLRTDGLAPTLLHRSVRVRGRGGCKPSNGGGGSPRLSTSASHLTQACSGQLASARHKALGGA